MGTNMERQYELGTRLDALLDELVEAGWPGEFDARERAALQRLGYVPTSSDEAGEEHCCNDPEHMSPEYLARLGESAP